MRGVLDEFQSKGKEASTSLGRLKHNEAVTFSVNDPRIIKKKRIGDTVLLHIAPFHNDAEGNSCFLFSMPGYGAEIMCVGSFKVSTLVRIGMSANSAKLLVKELDGLFQ